jgi:glutamine amidotransferase PdxT
VTRQADPAGPAIGVLALQGDVAEHVSALGRLGATAVAVRTPDQLDQVAGLIIPGGESTTMWKLAVAFDPWSRCASGWRPACRPSAAAPG